MSTPRYCLLLLLPLLAACATAEAPRSVQRGALSNAWADDVKGMPGLADPGDELAVLLLLTASAESITGGRADEALPALERVLEAHPDHATARFLRGVAQLQLGDLTGARDDLMRAVELDPTDSAAPGVLARVQHELGDEAAAIASLEIALSRGDDHPWTLASLGHLLLDAGRWDEAYDAFQRALASDPDEVSAHRGIGILFSAAGDPERAAQAWRQVVALDGADIDAHVGLGHALRDCGRREEALLSYEDARRLDPAEPLHAANIASTLHDLHRYGEAVVYYEEALADEQLQGVDLALLHFGLGLIMEELAEVQRAVEEYESALLADDHLAAAHEALGMVLREDDPARALRHLILALEFGGIGPEAAMHLALLHEGEGDFERARHLAGLLLAADPSDPEVSYCLAELHVRSLDPQTRDPAAAVALLRPLLDGPRATRPEAWGLLGEALAADGHLDEALAAVERALAGSDPAGAHWRRFAADREAYATRAGPEHARAPNQDR